jgi:hypothetical protein
VDLSNAELLDAVHQVIAESEARLATRVDELDKRINGRIRVLEDWKSWAQGHAAGMKQVKDGRAWIPAAVAGTTGAIGAAVVGSLILLLK